jgi:hypothetical protein
MLIGSTVAALTGNLTDQQRAFTAAEALLREAQDSVMLHLQQSNAARAANFLPNSTGQSFLPQKHIRQLQPSLPKLPHSVQATMHSLKTPAFVTMQTINLKKPLVILIRPSPWAPQLPENQLTSRELACSVWEEKKRGVHL